MPHVQPSSWWGSAALLAALLAAPVVRADGVLALGYTVANTATDEGPQDGVFDAFVSLNYGSVNDNGWTSFRTALEYDLFAIPAGAGVASATLRLVIGVWEGPRSLAVHAYAGDGAITLDDFSRDGLAGATTVPAAGTVSAEIDVSDAVRTLVTGGAAWAGFILREDPPNDFNHFVMFMEMDPPPVLQIALATDPATPPPEGCVAGGSPPSISLSPTPALLWPPRHQLVDVDLRATAVDACGAPIVPSCEVASSEVVDGLGDGTTSPDVVWTAAGLQLRAERSGDGHGRTYAITCRATDAGGASAVARGVVTVPHDARPSPGAF